MSRGRRSRRGRSRRSGGNIGYMIGGVLLLIGCIAFGGGYVWLLMSAEKRPELVAETLCPKDGPRSVTVVLVDASDDIPNVGRKQIQTYLEDTAETLPEYGLLEMRLLDPSVEGGRIVFSRCNPGDGSNLSELVANPEAVRKRWAKDFRKPLDDALAQGLAPSAAKTSPIMETVQRIAVDRFDGRAVADVDKRLILVSDMIEHGDRYSQYKDGITWEAFEKNPARRVLRTDLHGAEVSIRCIQRNAERFGTRSHMEFWEQWIRDNGGEFVDAETVQGAA